MRTLIDSKALLNQLSVKQQISMSAYFRYTGGASPSLAHGTVSTCSQEGLKWTCLGVQRLVDEQRFKLAV
jgi:hypothetical protein